MLRCLSLLSTTCFALLAPQLGQAQTPNPNGNETRLEQLIKRFDTNGDGKLSPAERAAARKSFGQPRRNPNQAEPKSLTWTVKEEKREALIFIPKKKTEGGSPVVFGFHGHGGNAQQAARSFGLHQQWPEALVVYMQGLPTPGRLTDPEGKRNGWQHSAGEQQDRDLKFFDAVLNTLKENYPIDENRIYSTGHSNGGGFTYLLWANRPDVFAAIAPSAAGSGSLRKSNPRPIPVMHLAGTNDQLVKYRWQQFTMQRVRKINGCQSECKDWAKDCKLYASKTGTPVVEFIHSGTHKYPTEGPSLIVKFFKEHKKPSRELN